MRRHFFRIAVWSSAIGTFAMTTAVRAQNLGQDVLEKTGQEAGLQTGAEPGERLPEIIGGLIQAFIGLLGVIFLVLMVYGGWLWLTARGESDRVEKAKETLYRAVIGMVIIVSAYAITSFVIDRLINQ